MFKEKYKKAVDSVKLSDESKEEVLTDIKKRCEKRKSFRIVSAVAVAACLCIAATAVLMSVKGINSKHSAKPDDIKKGEVLAAKSYADVYAQLEKTQKNYETLYKGELNGVDAALPETNEVPVKTTEAADGNYSKTNTQVKDVDEADIIKTDGKYIYVMNYENGVKIYKAAGSETKLINTISLTSSNTQLADCYNYKGMYLYENYLILHVSTVKAATEYLMQSIYAYETEIHTVFYDITDPENPKKKSDITQDGNFCNSRLSEGILYTVSRSLAYTDWRAVDEKNAETYIPNVCGDLIPASAITILDDTSPNFCIVTATAMDNIGQVKSKLALLGNVTDLYASKNNILMYNNTYENTEYNVKINKDGSYEKVDTSSNRLMECTNAVTLYLISLNGGNLKLSGSTILKGNVDDQFSIDEYNGYFRILTTYSEYRYIYNEKSMYYDYSVVDLNGDKTVNNLYVLNGKLSVVGSIENIAKNEYVKSARFMGDVGYFVTFRQTDPLFAVDLKDPKNPKITGKLKIPGFSEYLQSYGDRLLFGLGYAADETEGGVYGVKLSMFDVSDPTNPIQKAYCEIDGEYLSACYNHKAVLADAEKNIIGFPGMDCYYIYSYTDGKFKQEGKVQCTEEWTEDMRGLYIGNDYYVADIRTGSLSVLDLNTFEQTAYID